MKNRIILIIITVFLMGNSSCFLIAYKKQTIENRLIKNSKRILKSDFSKINFNGIYVNIFNDTQNPKTQIYSFYKFFPDGKVFLGGFRGKEAYKVNYDDYSNGVWSIFYIQNNNIYIEQFNGYMGYTLYAAYFSENNKKIIFTDYRTRNGRIIFKLDYFYTFQSIN